MTQPVSIRLEDANRENIDRFAKLTKRSRSFIVNEALEAYLVDRMAYVEDLNAAVASIDTEPSYSAEQVHTWMRAWGTEDEASARKAMTPIHPQRL